MLLVPKTKRLGPPTEALGYPRQPARISKGNIVARIIQSVIEIKNDGTSTRLLKFCPNHKPRVSSVPAATLGAPHLVLLRDVGFRFRETVFVS